jgi:hypothetical protein
MVKDRIWCWYRKGTVVGVVTAERHVAEEVIDVGKTSSSWMSMMKKWSLVAQCTPQKPYRISPIKDRKRRSSGGPTVHTVEWDGEGCGDTVL